MSTVDRWGAFLHCHYHKASSLAHSTPKMFMKNKEKKSERDNCKRWQFCVVHFHFSRKFMNLLFHLVLFLLFISCLLPPLNVYLRKTKKKKVTIFLFIIPFLPSHSILLTLCLSLHPSDYRDMQTHRVACCVFFSSPSLFVVSSCRFFLPSFLLVHQEKLVRSPSLFCSSTK